MTATVAALAGVAEHESGLASGLNNTAFQIGAALGVAIVTTVAVSSSEDYLAANDGANPLVALNEGFQSAFLACVVLAGIGIALALLILGRPRKSPPGRLEPAPRTPRHGPRDADQPMNTREAHQRRTRNGKDRGKPNSSL